MGFPRRPICGMISGMPHPLTLAFGSALAAAAIVAPSAHYSVGPITQVSSHCTGSNAEVEQAVHGSHIYEEWMNCGKSSSIGFASSANGGKTWSRPLTLPDSAGSWDPSVAVSPEGVVYAAYMQTDQVSKKVAYSYPIVDTSTNNGASFTLRAKVNPNVKNNWGDRDFILAGPHGAVYLTWDYGPSAADVKFICNPNGSCAFSNGDLNVAFQRSTDYGKTWGPIVHVSPGFPASGGDSGPMVLEPNGNIAIAYQGYHIYNKKTFAMSPAYMYFTQSSDGGLKWSRPLRVGASAGTMSLAEWWIDGAIGVDRGGDMYITWDTQSKTRDIGWLSYSTDHGMTWSAPVRVTPDNDLATHIVEVAGDGPGIAYVGTLADNAKAGYAQYVRVFSVHRGWISPVIRVSKKYGSSKIWPGDTFGINLLSHDLLALSWGSAVDSSSDSAIWATTVRFAG
jgi:hypothetical protein